MMISTDTTAVAAAVRAERLSLCDLLDQLDDADWATRSLCSAWTVREVVAHLTTTTRTSVPSVIRAAFRARGDFDRMEVTIARERAASYGPAELVERLRESAESSRRTPFSSPMDPLMDLVVHGQDIARPLGLARAVPDDIAVPVLAYLAGNKFLGGPKRLAGLCLVATDAVWTSGEGPSVEGRAVDLMLVATGRPAGLADLIGPGVQRLAERIGGLVQST